MCCIAITTFQEVSRPLAYTSSLRQTYSIVSKIQDTGTDKQRALKTRKEALQHTYPAMVYLANKCILLSSNRSRTLRACCRRLWMFRVRVRRLSATSTPLHVPVCLTPFLLRQESGELLAAGRTYDEDLIARKTVFALLRLNTRRSYTEDAGRRSIYRWN